MWMASGHVPILTGNTQIDPTWVLVWLIPDFLHRGRG